MNIKLILASVAAVVLLGTGYMLGKRSFTTPTVKQKIVYVDKVVTTDRVVIKDVHSDKVTVTTKPDGTKIVETDKSTESTHDTSHVDETVKIRQIEKVTFGSLSKYSLGLGVRLDPFKPLTRIYTAEAGARLGGLPLWVTAGVDTQKNISLGVRYEF